MLDDNRMYRRTDPPPPPPPAPKPKANSRKGKAAARASKRRKTVDVTDSGNDAGGESGTEDVDEKTVADDGFGGRKWECIAITLSQYKEFLESIQKSRDPDEKALHRRISLEVLPTIEKAEEAQLRRTARKERELMNQEKLATAKRSSRLASKQDKEREEREAMEAERKRKADLAEALKDQERQINMDEARRSRMMTREQRLKEREYKRILHEEELASLSEDNKKLDAGEARLSERHLKAEMDKKKKELAALAEEDVWFFDCSKCGIHGENLVDPASLHSNQYANDTPRMMALIALLVKSVMSGSIVHATVSPKKRLRRMTFISSVETACAEKRMPRSPKLPLSNFT